MGDRVGRGLAYTCSGASACKYARRQARLQPPQPQRRSAGRLRSGRQQARRGDRRSGPGARARIPTMAPTPGIGQPDGRMGLQDQVTPDRPRSGGIPRLHGCFRSARSSARSSWRCCCGRSFAIAAAQTRCRRATRTTPTIEVIWTLVPVLILVADRDPIDPPLSAPYSPPPADVTVKVTGHQWYWSYEYPDHRRDLRQLHAEGSERPDAAEEPARSHRCGRPAATRGRPARRDSRKARS